ncbi:MAG TPA: hypothetical protein VFF69_14800 [Phycisphaerales bacterium]|nr:hypothetical protein [Phycisphaerales bacterium]
MRTPSDQQIEDRLAALAPVRPGEPPAAFIGAVRARRRRVVARRSAVAAGSFLLGAALVLALPRLSPSPPPAPARIAADRGAALPPLPPESSMLALRQVWDAQAGESAPPADWLAAIPAGYAPEEPEPALRLGDRVLREGL